MSAAHNSVQNRKAENKSSRQPSSVTLQVNPITKVDLSPKGLGTRPSHPLSLFRRPGSAKQLVEEIPAEYTQSHNLAKSRSQSASPSSLLHRENLSKASLIPHTSHSGSSPLFASRQLSRMTLKTNASLSMSPKGGASRLNESPERRKESTEERGSIEYWRKMLREAPTGSRPNTFAGKLDRLHLALQSKISLLHRFGYHSVTADTYLSRHSSIKQIRALKDLSFSGEGHIDFGKLGDIKAVFEYSWLGNSAPGLSEEEFTDLVAPLLCRSFPTNVKDWVSTIDDDSAGYIDWVKFSAFLVRDFEESFHQHGQDTPQEGSSAAAGATAAQQGPSSAVLARPPTRGSTVAGKQKHHDETDRIDGLYHSVPEGYDKSPTGFRITKCHFCERSHNYYTYCSDGAVRKFDGTSLNVGETVHFPDNTRAVDMKVNSERDLLYVAQDSGKIYLYDISGEMHRTGNLLKVFSVYPGENSEEFVHKTVPYDPLRMEMVYTGIARKQAETVKLKVPVMRLDTKSVCSCAIRASMIQPCSCKLGNFSRQHQLHCIEPTRSLFPAIHQQTDRDPFILCGFEGGHIAMYPTELAGQVGGVNVMKAGNPTEHRSSSKIYPAVSVWQPHTSFVTKIMVSTTHREMYGWVSSSLDGSIQIMDCVKQETALTLLDAADNVMSHVGGISSAVGLDGGYHNGVRPVTSFDISGHSPLIASCTNMRMVNLWSPITRRKVACFGEHKSAVIDVSFNNEMHQLVSLGDDRTLRVWDLRTYRCVQIITDKERRKCQEQLSALTIDSHRNAIVACGGLPFVWKNLAQEMRKELGVERETFGLGHTDRVRDVVVNEHTGHCITSDGFKILVWQLDNFSLVRTITPGAGRVCSLLTKDRQLFTGNDSGTIQVWSHVSGKELRVLTGGGGGSSAGAGAQCSALSQIPVSHDENFIHSCIIAAFKSNVHFYAAKATPVSTLKAPSALISVPIEDPLFVVDALDTTTPSGSEKKDLSISLRITALSCSSSGRHVIAGLTYGNFSIIGVSSLTGPQLLSTVHWLRPVRQIQSAERSLIPSVKTSQRPGSSALWKKAAQHVRETERRTGSADFTKFRHSAQQESLTTVEAVTPISLTYFLVAFGSGDGAVYETESSQRNPVACLPLSYKLGEAACVAFSSETKMMYCGETGCRVSVFSFEKVEVDKQSSRPQQQQHRREYHNSLGLSLIESTSYGSVLVNGIAICSRKEAYQKNERVLVGLESSSVMLIDPIERCRLHTLGLAVVESQRFLSTVSQHRFSKIFPAFAPDEAENVMTDDDEMSESTTVPRTRATEHQIAETETSNDEHLDFLTKRFPYLTGGSSTELTGSSAGKGKRNESNKDGVNNTEVEAVVSQKTVQALMKMSEHKEQRLKSFDKVAYKRLQLSDISFGKK